MSISTEHVSFYAIVKSICEFEIEKLCIFATGKKSVSVFRLLVEKDRLDIIKKLSEHNIFITHINVTYALKQGKYDIVKWAISINVLPNFSKVYHDANETNNFEIVNLLVSKGYKLTKRLARRVYEKRLMNVSNWLNSQGFILNECEKVTIDIRRQQKLKDDQKRKELRELLRKKNSEATLSFDQISEISYMGNIYNANNIGFFHSNIYSAENHTFIEQTFTPEFHSVFPVVTSSPVVSDVVPSPISMENSLSKISSFPISTENSFPKTSSIPVSPTFSINSHSVTSPESFPGCANLNDNIDDTFVKSLFNENYFTQLK